MNGYTVRPIPSAQETIDEQERAARSAEIMARVTGSSGCTYVVTYRALDGTRTELARAEYRADRAS